MARANTNRGDYFRKGKKGSCSSFNLSGRNTPEYKLWRLEVYKRDQFQCRKCGRKNPKKSWVLQAHHIYSWSKFPELRYLVSNGITLCKPCHALLFGNENAYIVLCKTLISNTNTYVRVQDMLRKEKEQENEIAAEN